MDRLSENMEREGYYPEAESLARETLETRRRVLGTEHADTIASVHTLAAITLSEGHYAQSEQLNRDALPIDQRVFGAEHPLTLTTMSYLARALSEQGKISGGGSTPAPGAGGRAARPRSGKREDTRRHV
jgi:hypothetical protein